MSTASPALEVLGLEDCTSLLASHTLGRLGFVDGQQSPSILPVNYRFHAPTSILVRTGNGSKLDFVPLRTVAFEIDGYDPGGRWGWSVLARGVAFELTRSLGPEAAEMRTAAPSPWAPGEHGAWLRIICRQITGRRFVHPYERT